MARLRFRNCNDGTRLGELPPRNQKRQQNQENLEGRDLEYCDTESPRFVTQRSKKRIPPGRARSNPARRRERSAAKSACRLKGKSARVYRVREPLDARSARANADEAERYRSGGIELLGAIPGRRNDRGENRYPAVD